MCGALAGGHIRTFYCIKVLPRLCVKFLCLRLQLLKSPFGVDIHGIFGVVPDVETLLQLLWRPREAFPKAFETHRGPRLDGLSVRRQLRELLRR